MPNGSRSAVPPGLRPLGAILAGGRSRRYGTPKAFAEVGGVSLVERARRALAPSTRAVILVGDDPRLGAFGLPLHPDVHPDVGPLAGLHTALRAAVEAGAPGAFVLACDLPLVPAELVRALVLCFAEAGGTRAVLPESPGPLGVEPLCGCYPVEWLAEVTRRVEAVARAGQTSASMIALIRENEPTLMPLEEVSQIVKASVAFLNVNRPEDRERAEALSRGG